MNEISIQEVAKNRLWVRFASERDQRRALNMEP